MIISNHNHNSKLFSSLHLKAYNLKTFYRGKPLGGVLSLPEFFMEGKPLENSFSLTEMQVLMSINIFLSQQYTVIFNLFVSLKQSIESHCGNKAWGYISFSQHSVKVSCFMKLLIEFLYSCIAFYLGCRDFKEMK